MKAAFLTKPGTIAIEDIPVPDCQPGTLLIKVESVGLCGSDLHYYKEGRIGDHIVTEPHILGHESAGIVVEVGEGVEGFVPGDRVAVEPGVPCLNCEPCLKGRYNLCSDVQFMGAPPYWGTFREYLTHDPQFVFPLPDNVSMEQGALIEPLAVAYNAKIKADVGAGRSLLINGAGPIGLACLEMALVSGAAPVFVSEPNNYRREIAGTMGAQAVFNPETEDIPSRIAQETDGRLCDGVIEASGAGDAMMTAILSLKKGGSVAVVGMGEATVDFPVSALLKKEASVRGIYRYANFYPPVIAMLDSGVLRAETWVSHRYHLEELDKAINIASDPTAKALKMIITMGT